MELPTAHLLAPGFQKVATRPFFAPNPMGHSSVYDMDILMRDDLRAALNIQPNPQESSAMAPQSDKPHTGMALT